MKLLTNPAKVPKTPPITAPLFPLLCELVVVAAPLVTVTNGELPIVVGLSFVPPLTEEAETATA